MANLCISRVSRKKRMMFSWVQVILRFVIYINKNALLYWPSGSRFTLKDLGDPPVSGLVVPKKCLCLRSGSHEICVRLDHSNRARKTPSLSKSYTVWKCGQGGAPHS
jgi:hypothetical protein